MTTWTALLLNPEKISSIFTQTDTLLDAVDLHEFVLHRDGPALNLRFDVVGFPDKPPAKWRSQNFNRVQIQLTLVGVCSISVQGWSNKTRINLKLMAQDGGVRIVGENDFLKIDASAEFVQVDSISAYRDDG